MLIVTKGDISTLLVELRSKGVEALGIITHGSLSLGPTGNLDRGQLETGIVVYVASWCWIWTAREVCEGMDGGYSSVVGGLRERKKAR